MTTAPAGTPEAYAADLRTKTALASPLTVSRFTDVKDTRPKVRSVTWAALAAELGRHERRAHKDGPLFSPCTYPLGARRGSKAVELLTMLVLEFDGAEPPWALLDGADGGDLTYLAYTTFSHWVQDGDHPVAGPHWRVVLPLSDVVPASAWKELYARARLVFPDADPACSDPARMQYFPACPEAPPVEPGVRVRDTGRWLNPDTLPPLPPKPPRETGDDGARGADGAGTPGDDFDARTDIRDLLTADGWTDLGERGDCEHWGRPGKDYSLPDTRCSATVNYQGNNLVHVFTSNAHPLQAGETYGPYRYVVAVRYGGDYTRATRELARQGYGAPPEDALEGLGGLAPGAAPHPAPSVNGHVASGAGAPGPAPAPATDLGAVMTTFKQWLHLDDVGQIYAVLGAVAANRMEGDPVWLKVVGASSGGKTEVLNAILGLPDVHPAATLTEAALLSGTPKRQQTRGATGGLLRQVGDFGILVCKDFTSVLSMNRERRAELLAALREIYDGAWTRHFGVDGGRSLSWSGKLGLLAGCTAAIDSYHQVVATMGERFLLYRLEAIDPQRQARQALKNTGKERQLRRELADAVQGLFRGLPLPDEPPPLNDQETAGLVALASLSAHARSGVERDGRTREVELILDPEAPARLAQSLRRLFGGMVAIGLPPAEAWPYVTKVGLDCMPKLRRGVFDRLLPPDDGDAGSDALWHTTRALATAVGYPTSTARRALEDLAAHGVVERKDEATGGSLWRLGDQARTWYAGASAVPEMSHPSESGAAQEGK